VRFEVLCECFPAFYVVSNEFVDGWRCVCLEKFLDEFIYVYCVECFGHVKCYCDCAFGGFGFVETLCDGVVDVVKCGGCGVVCFETVLCADVWNVGCDVWKDKFFDSFGDWRDE